MPDQPSAKSDLTACKHPDVRFFENEGGALACMKCGRLFGHVVGGYVMPYNPSPFRRPVGDPGEYDKRLAEAVELLERIEREASWIGSDELKTVIENFTDMMREDGWVR